MKIPERQPEIHQRIDSAPVTARVTDEDQRRTAYTPLPAHRFTAAKQKKRALPLAIISAVAVVGLVIGAVWLSGKPGAGQNLHQKPALTAPVQKMFRVRAADVSSQAISEAKSLLATPSPLTAGSSPPGKSSPSVATALAALTPQQQQEIVAGDRLFYKVVMFDNQIQDGDAVEVFLNGKSIGVVDLTNAGTELTIPLKSGETAQLTCLAVKDGGGGGVTFGARSSGGEERSRVMDVGASETWSINVQ